MQRTLISYFALLHPVVFFFTFFSIVKFLIFGTGKAWIDKDGQFHFIHTKKAHRAIEAIAFSIPKYEKTRGTWKLFYWFQCIDEIFTFWGTDIDFLSLSFRWWCRPALHLESMFPLFLSQRGIPWQLHSLPSTKGYYPSQLYCQFSPLRINNFSNY